MRTLDGHALRRLIDVGRALTSDLDLEVVLRRVVHTARELTGARYAALGILDETRSELERFLTAGVDGATRREIGDPPRGRGVLGVLIRDPRPLRLANVGSHPSSYGFPPGHPPMETFLGVPIIVRGEVFGNLYLADKHGGAPFDEADEESTVVLAEWASVAIENARLYSRVESRRLELERAVRGLAATTAITRSLGGESDLERVLELVAKRGRAVVEASALVVLLEEGDELRVAAAAGRLPDGVLGARVETSSAAGQALRALAPERVPDLSARLHHGLDRLGDGWRSALLAPLAFRGHGHGVLCALDRLARGPEFDEDDEQLLDGFATAAAIAVATARSAERERLLHSIEVQEQERRRWARELHDQTLQGLGALQLLLSAAQQSGRRERVDAAVKETTGLIAKEIDGLRAIIADLRPAALDELGTKPALEALAGRVAATSGIPVDVAVDLDYEQGRAAMRHRPELESTIYRVVQEGLTNAGKHSRASRVRVSVREAGGGVEVTIADDGIGFDPARPGGGFGLIGMRERVGLVGGRLEIDSAPGRGTSLVATLPVERVRPASARIG